MNPRNLIIAAVILFGVVSTAYLFLPSGPVMPPGLEETGDGFGRIGEARRGDNINSEKGSGSRGDSSSDEEGPRGRGGESSGLSGFDSDGNPLSGRPNSGSGDTGSGGIPGTNENRSGFGDGSGGGSGRGNPSRNSGNRGRNPSSSKDESRSGTDSEGNVRVAGKIWDESKNSVLTDVNGQLEVGVDNRSSSVSVVNGSFSFEAPAKAMVRFFSAVLDERPARVIAPTTPLIAEGAGSVRVYIRYDSLATLNVLSAETGAALNGIEVVRLQDFHRSTLEHPGWPLPSDYYVEESESPVSLDGRLGMIGSAVVIHVRAAGHEWKRLTVDLVAGGERDVLLYPAADVNLVLDGDTNREDVKLRLRAPNRIGMPFMEMPILGVTSEMIQGLLPGTWQATLESGHWNLNPTVHAETFFDVFIGEQNSLQMTVPADDEERSDLAGSVFVPDGWFLDNFSVRVRPTGAGSDPVNDTLNLPSAQMSFEEVAGGLLYSWGPVSVKLGSYGILVLPVGYGDLFEVGPDGFFDAHLELPSPVDIRVLTLIAGGSGEFATPGLLRWAPVRPQGVPGTGAVPIPSVQDGVFEFQVPVGGVILSVSDQAYVPKHEQVSVTLDGMNEFEMELEPAMGVMLLLDQQGTSIPWDITWHPVVYANGHGGRVLTRGRTGSGYRILVSEPGEYTVELPQMDGFLPLDPFGVQCIPSEVLDVLVPLEIE
ncbi:MAG: hypothetical protein CBC13_01785 [Planctomycetia bacterium TMED53]|nr:MAG: hypothetical protein CBC13_01785 [Planctomycetia bacterium TMED53]